MKEKRSTTRARAQFNDLRLNRTVDPNREWLIASLFLLLTKTCFRGLFRDNQDGELVCSFGYFKRPPKIVNPKLIKKFHRLFIDNDVEFYCCS